MKRLLVFGVAAIVLLAGLWYADARLVNSPIPAPPPTDLPTQTPEPTPLPAASSGPRIVVLSLAGAEAGRVQGYLADGTMPSLARLKDQGAMAPYALAVDPALAAPAHAALASGSYPAVTGVVADRYHRAPDDLNSPTDALAGAESGGEPVWRTAMREARRTAALFWPGTSLDAAGTLADLTVASGAVDAEAAQHVVTFTEVLTWTGAPASFSPLREGTLTIRKNGVPLARVQLLAVDSTDDGQQNYDTYILDRSRQVTPASARLHLGETAPLLIDDRAVSGAYFTLSQVDADRVTVFQSRVCYDQAQPDELVREVNRRFGFYPPDPDGAALQRGWISPDQYLRMAEIQSRWMVSVTTFVLAEYRPEVLFASLPAAADLQRQFLLVDPLQPGYSPEQAAQGDGYVRRGYALADAALGQVSEALNLGETTLLVVSDHGMAPVHSRVYLNTILAAQKLLVWQGPDSQVSVAQSKAFALASGGAGHIYINLQGRERAGIVPREQYQELQDRIVAALQKMQDKGGRPLFSRVLRREELGQLYLDAPTAGDVFVQAAPGYALSDACGQPAILGPAADLGEGGLEATRPQMQAIFLAVGRGIRPGLKMDPVHILDLAPTVDRLLGLQPPASLTGRVLEEMLLP